MPRRGLRAQVTVAALALVVSVLALSAWPSAVPARPLPANLVRTRSGLVMADTLEHRLSAAQLGNQYVLDGSAGARLGWSYETRQGLLVGVKAHRGWAGWFAVTVHAGGPSVAWHTDISPGPVPAGKNGRGIAVFAVQTATTQYSGAINYIVVAAVCNKNEYRWVVGYGHGIVAGASTRFFWKSPRYFLSPSSASVPALPVTVVTDGYHRVAVWLGSTEVLDRTDLSLDIPPPFQAYLEVQSSAPAYAARFTNFWAAEVRPLEVVGLARGSVVSLAKTDGQLLASAHANRLGTAVLKLPVPELAGTGILTLGRHSADAKGDPGSAGRRPAGESERISYAGGDVLRFVR